MRYAELRPDQLAAQIEQKPTAIWPIGALEWHGPHLPLGLDGIVAEEFCLRLRQEAGGVLLPCLWHPITTLPHPMSLDVPTSTFRQIVQSTAEGLADAGFNVLCIVTGHYAQGHSLELFALAEELAPKIAVLTASPLEPLEDDSFLDHAGTWEAAQLLAIRPELANLDGLPEEITPKSHGVLGKHPRLGDPQAARAKWNEAIALWRLWIDNALKGETAELQAFYGRRREHYRPYVEKYYRESWEQAIADWWAD